jgi:predicted TIM-barrel fold metal-dependent hydrolase
VHLFEHRAATQAEVHRCGVDGLINVAYSNLGGFRDVRRLERAMWAKAAGDPSMAIVTCLPLGDFLQPEWSDRVIEKIRSDRDRGALGVKIWKDLGMALRGPDGRLISYSDPKLQAIFRWLDNHGMTVYLHAGDPPAAWRPLEDASEVDRRYFLTHPEYYWHGRDGQPVLADLLSDRELLVRRWSRIHFVCCHLASLGYDLDELARFLDVAPNCSVDTSGRLDEMMQHENRRVREFFENYASRILFGTDLSDSEDASFARPQSAVFQRLSRRYDRWAHYLEAELSLPTQVLRAVYFGNAARLQDRAGAGVVGRGPRDGWARLGRISNAFGSGS